MVNNVHMGLRLLINKNNGESLDMPFNKETSGFLPDCIEIYS